jgi:hypothetical protein
VAAVFCRESMVAAGGWGGGRLGLPGELQRIAEVFEAQRCDVDEGKGALRGRGSGKQNGSDLL